MRTMEARRQSRNRNFDIHFLRYVFSSRTSFARNERIRPCRCNEHLNTTKLRNYGARYE